MQVDAPHVGPCGGGAAVHSTGPNARRQWLLCPLSSQEASEGATRAPSPTSPQMCPTTGLPHQVYHHGAGGGPPATTVHIVTPNGVDSGNETLARTPARRRHCDLRMRHRWVECGLTKKRALMTRQTHAKVAFLRPQMQLQGRNTLQHRILCSLMRTRCGCSCKQRPAQRVPHPAAEGE